MMPANTAAITMGGAHVAIDDVRQLVPEHRLQLGIVHGRQQAAGDGDAEVALVQAAGEGVEAVGLDDAQGRQGQAARDAEAFQQVVAAWLGLAGERLGEPVAKSMICWWKK